MGSTRWLRLSGRLRCCVRGLFRASSFQVCPSCKRTLKLLSLRPRRAHLNCVNVIIRPFSFLFFNNPIFSVSLYKTAPAVQIENPPFITSPTMNSTIGKTAEVDISSDLFTLSFIRSNGRLFRQSPTFICGIYYLNDCWLAFECLLAA